VSAPWASPWRTSCSTPATFNDLRHQRGGDAAAARMPSAARRVAGYTRLMGGCSAVKRRLVAPVLGLPFAAARSRSPTLSTLDPRGRSQRCWGRRPQLMHSLAAAKRLSNRPLAYRRHARLPVQVARSRSRRAPISARSPTTSTRHRSARAHPDERSTHSCRRPGGVRRLCALDRRDSKRFGATFRRTRHRFDTCSGKPSAARGPKLPGAPPKPPPVRPPLSGRPRG
jgi:hypothetical protein